MYAEKEIKMSRTAEIHKEGKLYAVKLFCNKVYEETVYARYKRDIKLYINKLGYTLTYDFTKLQK